MCIQTPTTIQSCYSYTVESDDEDRESDDFGKNRNSRHTQNFMVSSTPFKLSIYSKLSMISHLCR